MRGSPQPPAPQPGRSRTPAVPAAPPQPSEPPHPPGGQAAGLGAGRRDAGPSSAQAFPPHRPAATGQGHGAAPARPRAAFRPCSHAGRGEERKSSRKQLRSRRCRSEPCAGPGGGEARARRDAAAAPSSPPGGEGQARGGDSLPRPRNGTLLLSVGARAKLRPPTPPRGPLGAGGAPEPPCKAGSRSPWWPWRCRCGLGCRSALPAGARGCSLAASGPPAAAGPRRRRLLTSLGRRRRLGAAGRLSSAGQAAAGVAAGLCHLPSAPAPRRGARGQWRGRFAPRSPRGLEGGRAPRGEPQGSRPGRAPRAGGSPSPGPAAPSRFGRVLPQIPIPGAGRLQGCGVPRGVDDAGSLAPAVRGH